MLSPNPTFLEAHVPPATPFMARYCVECNMRAIKFRHGSDDLLPARPLAGAQQSDFTSETRVTALYSSSGSQATR